jgi:hypothetical protein
VGGMILFTAFCHRVSFFVVFAGDVGYKKLDNRVIDFGTFLKKLLNTLTRRYLADIRYVKQIKNPGYFYAN